VQFSNWATSAHFNQRETTSTLKSAELVTESSPVPPPIVEMIV
jgi:hypothetical protein